MQRGCRQSLQRFSLWVASVLCVLFAHGDARAENIKFGIPAPHLQAITGITNTTTSSQLAASMTTTYGDACDSSSAPCTMSAANISGLSNLITATNSLAQVLNTQMATSAITLTNIQSIVQRFEMNNDNVINTSDSYIDLYDFARLVKAGFADNNIQQTAQAVMDATTAYITVERHRSGITGGHTWNLDNSHGVSVFFPTTASSFYSAGNYDFATGALWPHMTQTSPSQPQAVVEWGPMLVNYFQTTQPGGPDNPIPPQVLPQQILFQVYLPVVLK